MAKTLETNRDWRAYWNSVGQRADPQDLFRQVDRTVSGRAVGPGEVQRLVDAVIEGLDLTAQDGLLDLCCGNGLITGLFAPHCRAVVGVDYSEYLIEVARQNASADNIVYMLGSVEDLDALDFTARPPNKVSINGGVQHFSVGMLDSMLAGLGRMAPAPTALMFTDVPDADRIFDFYDTPERREDFQRRRDARAEAIGTWWSREEMAALLGKHGYRANFAVPVGRSSAHYRFDVTARLDHAAG